jgi:hypothetical protein
MHLHRSLAALAAAASFVAAAPASAQNTSSEPTCRASAARVTLPPLAASEPAAANATAATCATDRAPVLDTAPIGPVTVAAPEAATRRQPGLAGATSRIAGVKLDLGGVAISVGAVDAAQVSACVGTRAVSGGTSQVDDLVIAGQKIELIAGEPVDLDLGLVRVRANVVDGGTRRALVLDVAGAEVVLGEASVSGNPCAPVAGAPIDADGDGDTDGYDTNGDGRIDAVDTDGDGKADAADFNADGKPDLDTNGDGKVDANDLPGAAGDGTTGAGANGMRGVCPDGATYDAQRGVCVLRRTVKGADGSTQSRTIDVGRPFQGPSGGSLLPLDEARRLAAEGKLPQSACLRGAGPAYVIVGDAKADRITGTDGADRIISGGGADRLDGGRGDDCLDGGADRDVLSGALGDDRVYGGAGRDSLTGGSGDDVLSAGAGNDTVHTGYGRDRVSAGAGNDAINAATAGPAARRIDCGPGRDRLRANRNERKRLKSCEARSYIR